MDKDLRTNLRRMTALLLTVSMVFGSTSLLGGGKVYAQELQDDSLVTIEPEYVFVEEAETDCAILEEADEDLLYAEFEDEANLDEAASLEEYDYGDAYRYWTTCYSYDDPLLIPNRKQLERKLAVYLINTMSPLLADEYDQEPNLAIRNMARFTTEDNSKESDEYYGVIGQGELSKIKSLLFMYKEDTFYTQRYSYTTFTGIQFDQLALFDGLETLTIEGHNNINNISIPASLKTLVLKNCTINTELNLSECSQLEKVIITDCTFTAGHEIIPGLDSGNSSLKNLQTIQLDRSNVKKIILATSGVTSSGLGLSTNCCGSLKEVNTGAYRVTGSPNFYRCTELESLKIKGRIENKDQTLKLSECYRLSNIDIEYFFQNETNFLTIDASAISIEEGTFKIAISAEDGSKTGTRYKLKAVDTSYIYKTALSSYSNLFDGFKAASYVPKYIVFEQDKDNFEKKSGTERNYSKSPLCLHIGQSVSSNRVYCYTEDYFLIPNQTYSVLATNSDVIKVENKGTTNTITALKPGTAEVTVTCTYIDSNKIQKTVSKTQNVIVMDKVTKLSIDEVSSDNEPRKTIYYKPGQYEFSSTMWCQDTSTDVIKNTYGRISWHIEKNVNSKWEDYTTSTKDGLTVFFNNNSVQQIDGENVIKNISDIKINSEMVGAKFRLWGEVIDWGTKSTNTSTTPKYENQYYEFDIINVGKTGDHLMYQSNQDIENSDGKYVEKISLAMSDIDGYKLVTKFVKKDDGTELDESDREKLEDFLKFNYIGKRKCELSFDSTKSSKEIAAFLEECEQKYGNKLVIKCSVYKEGNGLDSDVLIDDYYKTITTSGYFPVVYDTDGGTTNTNNPRGYYVPFRLYPKRCYDLVNNSSKQGYSFEGWYINGVKVNTVAQAGNLQGNPTVVAKWVANPVADKITETYVYTGVAILPAIQVHDGSRLLSANDYTLSYKNNVNAYTLTESDTGFNAAKAPTVLIKGKGNYNNNGGVYFTIMPRSIDSDDFTVTDVNNYLYSGRVVSPVPKVNWGAKTLSPSKDYYVEYYKTGQFGVTYNSSTGKWSVNHIYAAETKPKDEGKYIIRICGKGNYTGDICVPFEILPKEQTISCSLSSEGWLYNGGNPVNPLPIVKYKDKVLEKDKDYTLSYKNNINVYTYTGEDEEYEADKAPTITVKGKGIYTGITSITYTIQPRSIASEVITVADIADLRAATGKNPTPVIKVNWDKRVLGNKDYSVSYFAGAGGGVSVDGDTVTIVDESKAVTNLTPGQYYARIKGIGNYAGEVIKSFTIIESDKKFTSGLTVKVKNKEYTGEAVTLGETDLMVYDGKTLLLPRTETRPEGNYTVAYENNVDVGTARVTITGVDGTYIGSKSVDFKITGKALSSAVISGFLSSVAYDNGDAIEQNITLIDKSTKAELRKIKASEYASKDSAAKRAYDYTYEYRDNILPGKATLILTGVNGYTGTVTKNFTVSGIAMNKVTVNDFKSALEYTGSPITQDITLSYKAGKTAAPVSIIGKPLSEYLALTAQEKKNVGCTIEYTNNVNTGTATMILTGVNGCTGMVKKNFKITPFNILPAMDTEDSFTVTLSSSAYYYDKSGVQPSPVVKFKGTELVQGKDYKLSYLNNKAVNDVGGKVPAVKVSGIGNYKGDDTSAIFNIVPRNIGDDRIVLNAPDATYTGRKGACRAAVSVVDNNGKKLAGKTDYSADVDYKYVTINGTVMDGSGKTPVAVTRNVGDEVGVNDIVPVGSKILATISGINNYNGTSSAEYRIIETDINKLAVKIDSRTFTGEAITLSQEDIVFSLKKKQVNDVTFQIIESTYANNTNIGKATVVIEGTGNYGGRRTLTYNIVHRGITWWWKGLGGRK